jgi:hypothetical protein
MKRKEKELVAKLLIAETSVLPTELVWQAVEALNMAHGFDKHWQRKAEPGCREMTVKEPARYFTKRMPAEFASPAQGNLRRFLVDMVIRLRHAQELDVLVLADINSPRLIRDIQHLLQGNAFNRASLIPLKITVIFPPNADAKARTTIDQVIARSQVKTKTHISFREAAAEELDVLGLGESAHAASLS